MYEYMAKWEEKNAIKNEGFKIAMELGFMEGWKRALESTKPNLPLADVSSSVCNCMEHNWYRKQDGLYCTNCHKHKIALQTDC